MFCNKCQSSLEVETNDYCFSCIEQFSKESDSWLDKIKYFYWSVVPHHWRPGEIWYRFICLFKRYSTIKPRWLGNTWIDKSELLYYVMFEILCQFVEDEMDSGIIDWESGLDNVWSELLRIYNWWNQEYLPFINGEIGLPEPITYFVPNDNKYKPQFKSKQDHDNYYSKLKSYNEDDDRLNKELEYNLIRLVKLRGYLWT